MKRRVASWLAGWGLALGCLLGSGRAARAQAFAQTPLGRLVQPTPGSRPLGAVLEELARQSRLSLSYSSSLVPLARRYAVRPGPPRPLATVLREVLGAAHLHYGLLDGQLVLWPDRAAAPPSVLAATSAINREPRLLAGSSAARFPAPTAAASGASQGGSPAAKLATRYGKQRAGYAVTHVAPPATTLAAARLKTTDNAPTPSATSKHTLPPRYRIAGSQQSAAKAAGMLLAPAASGARQGSQLASGPPAATDQRQGPKASRAARLLTTPYPAPLAPRPVGLVVASQPLPAVLPAAASVRPHLPADAARPTRGQLLPGLYLHGEAWLSESLPLGVTGKVGLARAYLVLGIAAGPTDHPAWAVGLGTAGRARGRFTPSLDLLEWFGQGNDHEAIFLTQLRPQLAWQLKRQGRLALLAGPTFNLATTDNHGSQRNSFGQHRWLGLDDGDGRGSGRFWPGIQVGLRF